MTSSLQTFVSWKNRPVADFSSSTSFFPSFTASESLLTSACFPSSAKLGERIFVQEESIIPSANVELSPSPGAPGGSCWTGCTPLCWREAQSLAGKELPWLARGRQKPCSRLSEGGFFLHWLLKSSVRGGRCRVLSLAMHACSLTTVFCWHGFLTLVTVRFFSLKYYI